MDAEEKEICDFLKSWPDQFVSHREICRRAGGKWRFRENQNWAMPVLSRMVEKGILESDASGHFRLMPEKKEEAQRDQGKLLKSKIPGTLVFCRDPSGFIAHFGPGVLRV